MQQTILPVTVHLNIRLPLALLQPEPAATPIGPEPDGSYLPSMKKLQQVLDVPTSSASRGWIDPTLNVGGNLCRNISRQGAITAAFL